MPGFPASLGKVCPVHLYTCSQAHRSAHSRPKRAAIADPACTIPSFICSSSLPLSFSVMPAPAFAACRCVRLARDLPFVTSSCHDPSIWITAATAAWRSRPSHRARCTRRCLACSRRRPARGAKRGLQPAPPSRAHGGRPGLHGHGHSPMLCQRRAELDTIGSGREGEGVGEGGECKQDAEELQTGDAHATSSKQQKTEHAGTHVPGAEWLLSFGSGGHTHCCRLDKPPLGPGHG